MNSTKKRLETLGVGLPNILIPKNGTDLERWAVVACDQYTSEKDYWKRVSDFVGDAPSTLKIIFPECYLEDGDEEERIEKINASMRDFLSKDLFDTFEESFFLVRRTCGKNGRWGLMVNLDLERYSWEKGSKSLIRATEGTILSRIPPRKKIRKDAPLEIPHIMVLISDPQGNVIEKMAAKKDKFIKAYDFELMEKGGHLQAWVINGETEKEEIASALETLYSKLDKENPLLFAMGDGNHSFATAKSCWEDIKKNLTLEEQKTHPARWCMVELENIFDEGLEFEPIHRILFNQDENSFLDELSANTESFCLQEVSSLEEIEKAISNQEIQSFGYCTSNKMVVVKLKNPKASIAAGTLQLVIDSLISKGHTVDYIHGSDVTKKIGSEKGNIGLFLPAIDKSTFFNTIVKDGALPRKTFSMGEANEKRFYMEARIIK